VPAEITGRYSVVEEIARGGMAAVYRARDHALKRDLALKVLLPKYANSQAIACRFVEEAQITAQLQHPSIVPIHEIGTLPDGRPYFAMKLIKGRLLAEMLRTRSSPSQDRLRLLGIFLQVCHAVAYAHSKGVIHRDLKPGNVMVGDFGEVQVMDWGLAKVLGRDHPCSEEPASEAGANAVETVRTADHDHDTEAGVVLGTFAYMAPEQARGEVASVDSRSDVFGLGAVLCEILTGAPPYPGITRAELRIQASEGRTDDVRDRLIARRAGAELVVLTLACLASEPVSRPANAGAVAKALETYLDGLPERPRQTEVARVRDSMWAPRRRSRLWLGCLFVMAILLVPAATYIYIICRQIMRQP
jgi:serine/threonine-protein kinase